jgi:intracellular sulfur oxidation DsrE/DsrF family protein
MMEDEIVGHIQHVERIARIIRHRNNDSLTKLTEDQIAAYTVAVVVSAAGSKVLSELRERAGPDDARIRAMGIKPVE